MVARTCIACREVAEKGELVRFIIVPVDGSAGMWEVQLDSLGKGQARGFYCHPTVSCLLSKKFDAQAERAARNSRPFRAKRARSEGNRGGRGSKAESKVSSEAKTHRLRIRPDQSEKPTAVELVRAAIPGSCGAIREKLEELRATLEGGLQKAASHRKDRTIRL